jgi:integrase
MGKKPKKPIRDLRDEEVHNMIALAKQENQVHYRMLLCLAFGGFRGGEVTGSKTLQGLQIQDLEEDGIWVNGKGGYRDFQALRTEVVKELKEEVGRRTQGKIFPYHQNTLYKVVRRYARLVGISDWKLIHPHSFRHFFGFSYAKLTGRDPWKVRDMMRHRSIQSTNKYVQHLEVEEKKKLAQEGLAFV